MLSSFYVIGHTRISSLDLKFTTLCSIAVPKESPVQSLLCVMLNFRLSFTYEFLMLEPQYIPVQSVSNL